jgi:AcrR family transcriptional regulator
MARDPEPARRSLIEAGERLFAVRGIRGVSLREINSEAGQRNTSALHYHFGSRDGLLRAILAPHTTYIRERRLELIAEVAASSSCDVTAAARVLIEPLALPLEHGSSGRAYAQIVPQLLTDSERSPAEVIELIGDTQRDQAYALLEPHCASMPPALMYTRLAVLQLQVVHAVADWARVADHPNPEWPTGPLDFFVANLVDMFVAALLCPPSARATALMPKKNTGSRSRARSTARG